ncbi:hypothetical protein GLOTRDRAFT_98318 [Gloeophyllum trabeum ATCC 11539]|uniref:Endopolyphosphatase n=1 Tax=Gloeophyllum trabeum (strain ATCC 11539 / FP-39264 / Madison 617) TaxID=670483 RepID=S7RWH8_GLOTA|nr:uncharacterized protein GLOTRDRAFT_98318 [Gloeophyllum trabeum ATCC 11539]EPQ59245.1 hypothetical protein GLOTRDRAFT_98318 [Gloeophyllum trabeum ATCC 11539]
MALKALVLALVFNELYAAPAQVPLDIPSTQYAKRKLQGRFLHITDMHPDPYYRPGASEKSACHRKKPKKDKTRAGYYGTPFSDCDSPFTLTNFTLDYLDKKWTSDIDFVIWTGDNARHDNDRKLPRTPDEIYHLNRVLANKMHEVFLSKGIPVVPSLGNNDVWLQNILMPGPNDITHEFSSIWKAFIPFPSLQVFQRGAYFSTEVIPNEIAVVSLNTMYFYERNKAVGGCEFKDRDDPGNLQLDWLDVQLDAYRRRGMKVWMSGHVPPSPGNYFPECYVRYAEMSLRYQDTILGHLFGHMNVDHFTLIEARDLEIPAEDVQGSANRSSPISVLKKKNRLYKELIEDFSDLPKSKKIDYDEYAVVNISPSVVPNPYLPSFRIFTYNITGGPKKYLDSQRKGHYRGPTMDRKKACRKGSAYQDTWWCQPHKPWHSDADAPSRTNALWAPLGYAQYNIRRKRLNSSSKIRKPGFKLEYMTFPVDALHPPADAVAPGKFKYPIPLHHLPRSLRNSTITESKFAPYQMRDLTIPSWVELAQRLARPKKEEKLRKRFRKYMYQGGREG